MKSILFSLAICSQLCLAAQSASTLSTIPENSQLAYNVDFGGSQYQFILEIKKKTPALVFDYNLTMGDGKQGTVTIDEAAMKTATAQQNMFGGGPMNLNEQTTVWVSSLVYNQIKKEGKTTIGQQKPMGVSNSEYELIGTEKMECQLNGETISLPCLHLRATDGSNFEYWIWDNPKDPLILKMSLGWGISIKEININ